MKKPKSEYSIQTVGNALRLLKAFQDEAEIGVTELSRRLGLHKNNVFRLLATLEEEGFVEQSPYSDRYRLGLSTLELGQGFCRGRSLLEHAPSILRELSRATGESSHVAVLDEVGFEVVHLDGVASDQLVLAALRVGQGLPVHCTALGKVLFGCSPEHVRQAYDRTVVADRPLPGLTRHTIVDPDKFFEHARTVAGQGFAIDFEECADGLGCAAAPVHDASGQVVAALSVSAPTRRVDRDALIGALCPEVMRAAGRLSRELGHSA